MLVIGDIHGCYDELQALLDRAGIADDELVVSVGDLVDRGPDPDAVLRWFQSRPQARVICGNHERKHVRGILSLSQQITRAQLGDGYHDHVRWMAGLPYHLETPDVRIVHWGLFPGVPLDDVPEDVRAGTTSGTSKLRARYGERPWYELYDDATPVVFGHAVIGPEPLVIDDRIFGIDTGACHGLRLTGLLLPQRTIVSVPAREDHWPATRRRWQPRIVAGLPWPTMTFEQIDKKLRQLATEGHHAEALDAVAQWTATLRAALPELARKLDAELDVLTQAHGDDLGRAVAAHPAAAWMQRRRLGRLSPQLGCSTPADVQRLAATLAVALPDAPSASSRAASSS